MPPRGAPGSASTAGRGRGARGGPSGHPSGSRGGPPQQGQGRGRGGPAIPPSRPPPPGGLPDTSPHITTVGVKRSAFGTSGRTISVFTNHYQVPIPEGNIYHYDGPSLLTLSSMLTCPNVNSYCVVVISPSEKVLPARLNMVIIRRLQEVVAPQVFTPRAAYDGRKNMFAARELPFGPSGTEEFTFTLSDASPGEQGQGGTEGRRGPKPYKVKLKLVATINPEVLRRFLQGKQSHDNDVLTAITALNVAIRMEPSLRYPFNVRSFFTEQEKLDIGGGIVLWRGYFQSVRPAIGKMLINVDISTGAMYKPGGVIDVALDFIGRPRQDPNLLAPRRGFPDRERIKLQRFLSGVRVEVNIPGQPQTVRRPARAVKKLTPAGAGQLSFTNRNGQTLTVAQYFEQTHNYRLRYPDVVCIEVGSGAILPIECCTIPAGQIMRKQVPADKTKSVVEFATKKPNERLASIRAGLGVLAYGQSEYVRQFGLNVASDAGPHSLQARILDPPTLQYGPGSRQPTIRPRDGAWNMIDKKFWKPEGIKRWMVVVFEREQRFRRDIAQEMVNGFLKAFAAVGMRVEETDPLIFYQTTTTRIGAQLREMGKQVLNKHRGGGGPDLIVAVLPETSADMYQAIKHFGDCVQGVATQCLKASKCSHAKPQYFANVCLKINVKLGGINTIPDARSVPALTDPHNPTIVMGADVIHPAPGADGRPSFTALVGNVDSDTAKYVADCRVQTSRQEMIDDLSVMAKGILEMYQKYRRGMEKKPNANPKRIIFYRDGVSEGQFRHVLDFELPQLKEACRALGIEAKITFIVVGKRHHVRFFPQRPEDAERSGNCPAGTVIDRDITHPTEFDFYLQSHSGLLGTSRPAHYNVLYDENNFTPDSLQALSFALCHVYARSTRSVSIPAPVYYADTVCSRAKNHYDPDSPGMDLSETATQLESPEASRQLEAFRANFRPLSEKSRRVMYFS
ncbi:argonaute-like protein [Daedaleopsis nitida]|nr:argonaute-like protein [Daedaleopsis nitida]